MALITNSEFHGGQASHHLNYTRLMSASVIDGRITEQDARQIKAFISEVKVCSNICDHRMYQLAYFLVGMRKWVPEFSSISTGVLFSCIEEFKASSKYKENTKAVLIKTLKRFLFWLHESGQASPNLNIDKLNKIKSKLALITKTHEDILTPAEVDAIFKAATTTRNRAILELLYESAGRIGEIATMRWEQVKFYSTYASVQISGKTGKPRSVPLYTSHIMLRRWKDQYNGGNPSQDDLVFPSRPGINKPFSYQGVLRMVKTTSKRAGIKKHITPHTFRHSRITHLLQQGVSESTTKMLAWGDIGSNMLKVYSHLTSADIERELSQLHGFTAPEEIITRDGNLAPRQCKKCGMINPISNTFCGGCTAELSDDVQAKFEQLDKELESDPKYQIAMMAALAALKKENEAQI